MIVLYARVSGHDQKEDLQRQVQQLEQWALVARTGQLTLTLTDIGSGLDTERKNLQRLLTLVQDYQVAEVVVTFSDRLTRFGLSYLRSLFSGLEQLTKSLNSAILSSTLCDPFARNRFWRGMDGMIAISRQLSHRRKVQSLTDEVSVDSIGPSVATGHQSGKRAEMWVSCESDATIPASWLLWLRKKCMFEASSS